MAGNERVNKVIARWMVNSEKKQRDCLLAYVSGFEEDETNWTLMCRKEGDGTMLMVDIDVLWIVIDQDHVMCLEWIIHFYY